MAKSLSVGLTKESHTLLKKASEKSKESMTTYVNKLITSLDLASPDKKVILSIPASLTKKDKEGLKAWLELRMESIISTYYPS